MTEQILAVQRMQEYIETHMEEAITTADLARVSRFSPVALLSPVPPAYRPYARPTTSGACGFPSRRCA